MRSNESKRSSYLVEIILTILVVGVPVYLLGADDSRNNIVKALVAFFIIFIIFAVYTLIKYKGNVAEKDELINSGANGSGYSATVEKANDQKRLQAAFLQGNINTSDQVGKLDRVKKLARSNYWMSVKVVQRRECSPMTDVSVKLLNEMKKYDRNFSVLSFIDECKQILQMYYDSFYYLKTELSEPYMTKALNEATVLKLRDYEEKNKRVQTTLILHDIYPTAANISNTKITINVFVAVEVDQYYCNYKNGSPYTAVKDQSRIRPLKLTFVSNRMYSELYAKRIKCACCGKIIDPYICDDTCNSCHNEINIKRSKWLLAGIEEYNANTIDEGFKVLFSSTGGSEYVS